MSKKFSVCGVAVVLVLIAYMLFNNDNGEVSQSPEKEAMNAALPSQGARSWNDGEPLRSEKRVTRVDGPRGAALYPRPFQQDKAELRNDPNDPQLTSEFAMQVEDPQYTEKNTVDTLGDLLRTFRSNVNGGHFDTAENIELTNALLGDNRKKIALLSANSSRINENGELVDSYGTPYYFHFISTKRLVVRSAGEDLALYTEDDVISAGEHEISEGIKVPGMDGFVVDP